MRVSILGAGAWGTALAIHAARLAEHEVTLWARDAAQIAEMRHARRNLRYLPDVPLPDNLLLTDDFACAAAVGQDGLCILATTLNGLRPLANQLADLTQCTTHIVWLCKGIEVDSLLMPHQIVADALVNVRGDCDMAVGALSGPSFAQEVAQGLPCALTIATDRSDLARRVIAALHSPSMRIYSSTDVVGVELGGAVKNILAIATGIADGMGLGLNARAALVTRGLKEMTRLGVALGGQAETFMGLTGLGDLLLTATGDLSRNRKVGLLLAQEKPLSDILAGLGHVAEGVRCARSVQTLARQHQVNVPIIDAVCDVLFAQTSPRMALQVLMNRDSKSE